MTDKIITHADLNALRRLREAATSRTTYYPDDTTAKLTPLALLDRLIAAAEADAPPLPEGWVLLRSKADGSHQALFYQGDGLYQDDDGGRFWDFAHSHRDRLTPLRPTITEADVERAAKALHEVEYMATWDALYEDTRRSYIRAIRAAFDAAGIEVQP